MDSLVEASGAGLPVVRPVVAALAALVVAST
jgi:hypothetical protein